MWGRIAFVVIVFFAALFPQSSSTIAAVDDTQARAKADSKTSKAHLQLEQLRWMQGTWQRTQGGDVLEESWSAPEADCMIGTFRWIKGGKLWMTELMTITIDDGVLVFRLRHFDRKQTPWEDKDSALTYPLESVGDREVVFENPEKDKPRRFHFSSPKKDVYEVQLIPPEGAETRPTHFRFQRKKD